MLNAFRPSTCGTQSILRSTLKWFGTTAAAAVKQMPPRPTVNEADIEEAFLKGSGPGGQKIVYPPLPILLQIDLPIANFHALRTKPLPRCS